MSAVVFFCFSCAHDIGWLPFSEADSIFFVKQNETKSEDAIRQCAHRLAQPQQPLNMYLLQHYFCARVMLFFVDFGNRAVGANTMHF